MNYMQITVVAYDNTSSVEVQNLIGGYIKKIEKNTKYLKQREVIWNEISVSFDISLLYR